MKITSFLIGAGLFATSLSTGFSAGVSVKTEYDREVNFAQYRSYHLDLRDTVIGPTGRAALQQALQAAMPGKGFTEAALDKANLRIVPSARLEQKTDRIPRGNEVVLTPNPRGYGVGTWTHNADERTYTQGTLILDFIDRKSNQLVFRAVAQGIAGEPKRNAERIREAVPKIVGKLPVKR